MSAVRTTTAARMLGVTASTLRTWERRYGHPEPRRTDGGHRLYDLAQLETLQQALTRAGGDIAGAIQLVQSVGRPVGSSLGLRDALANFDADRADRVLEESLAIRSVERTVDELLIPVLATLDSGSPEQAFTARYAAGWLAATSRTAPAATRDECVLIFDCTATPTLESLHTQALELCLRRTGLRVLTVSATLDHARVGRAVRAVGPSAVVLSGPGAELDTLGRLVYAVRQAAGHVAVLDYRGALPDTGASTVPRLDGRAPRAAAQLLDRVAVSGPGVARAADPPLKAIAQ